jgi:hypothetical protein
MAAPLNAAIFDSQFLSPLKNDQQKKKWLKLLHYQKNFLGQYEGIFDGPKFYFSANGKTSPEDELKKTIRFFNDSPQNKQECLFPERVFWLRSFGVIPTPKNPISTRCPELTAFKKGINAESATLVFTSAYPNNPSSMFGHVFIRLNQKNKKNDLLDYAISYSAEINKNDSSIFYAYNGIFGGYPGVINIDLYYQFVSDYIYGEGRDLYEYDLDLTTEEVDHFINHLWEIYRTTYADYYFLTENCASLLGIVLSVIRDDWALGSSPRYYYVPSDLAIELNNLSAIKKTTLRPSQKRLLAHKLKKLPPSATKKMHKVLKTKQLKNERLDVQTLDTLISFLNYKKFKDKGLSDQSDKDLFFKLLNKRAKIQTNQHLEGPLLFKKYNNPLIGHGAQELKLSYSSRSDTNFTTLSYKWGFHSLNNRELGFSPFSQFDVLKINLDIFPENDHILLKRWTLLDIVSLHPMTFYDRQFSWRAKFASDYDFFSFKSDPYAEASGGVNLNYQNVLSLAFLIGGRVNYQNSQIGLEAFAETPLIFNFYDSLKALLNVRFGSFFQQTLKRGQYLHLSSNLTYQNSKHWSFEIGALHRQNIYQHSNHFNKYHLSLGIHY